jgi:hypothetical protein
VNANRARLSLAPVDDVLGHILTDRPWLAADATLAPAPSTSGLRVMQSGAWILPDTSPLAPELEAFLDDGEPPAYVGFGSMPAVESTSRTLIDATRATGRRVILSQGWADLELIDDRPDCIAISDVNQQALFPRVAAIVHRGGAGTTTAAARAGAAQVAVPMFSDQFYWGLRIRDLGIGTVAPFAGLTTDTLASALHARCWTRRSPPARMFWPGTSPRTAPQSQRNAWSPSGSRSRRTADDPSVSHGRPACLACHAARTRLEAAPLPLTSASSNSAAAIARSRAARSSLAVPSVSSIPARAPGSRFVLMKSSVMTSPSGAWRAWS